jgi:hypothetical protein
LRERFSVCALSSNASYDWKVSHSSSLPAP